MAGNPTYEDRKKLGICIECHRVPVRGKHTRCRDCRKDNATDSVNRREAWKAEGRCPDCYGKEPLLPGLDRGFGCAFGSLEPEMQEWLRGLMDTPDGLVDLVEAYREDEALPSLGAELRGKSLLKLVPSWMRKKH